MKEWTGLALDGFNEDNIRAFVRDLYTIFVDREPDPEGLSHYTSLLKSGASVAETIAAFARSDEHMQKERSKLLLELIAQRSWNSETAPDISSWAGSVHFPEDYKPPGEAGRSYLYRLRSGFLHRYCSGPVVLDVGFAGYDNPDRKTALPHAIGIDLDYPGYDGLYLPFEDASVDTVFASHCLEHILFDHAVIQDWYRVLKVGGFIVCIVPSQALYEKKRFLPSRFNMDHKRMYTPAGLSASFEAALEVNSYRVRHLAENDQNFNYELGPDVHSDGAYEIEIVIEKIHLPKWKLA